MIQGRELWDISVLLKLQVKVAKDILVPGRRLASLLGLALGDKAGYFAAETP